MKKVIFLFLLLTQWISPSLAQEEFPVVWKSKFDFKPSVYSKRNPLGTIFIGISDKEIQALDENGKSLWKLKSESIGIKEVELVTWVKDAHVIRIGTKKTKKDLPISVFIDVRTGKELWRSTKITWMGFDGATIDESYISDMNAMYMQYGNEMVLIELNTGKEIWKIDTFANLELKSLEVFHPEGMDVIEVVMDEAVRSYYELKTGKSISKITSNYYKKQNSYMSSAIVSDEDLHVRLDYKNKIVKGSTGSKTKMVLSAKRFSTGDEVWRTEFSANMVTTLVTKEDMLRFFVQNNRIYVIYEGISVFDLKTGKELWKSEFNNSEVSLGLKAKQELGIACMPLVDGNTAYITDLTSGVYGISKVDATTGKTIWQSDKFSSSDVIPDLHLNNGVLIAQFGGVINIQTYIETDQTIRTTNKWKYRGNPDIKAFDAVSGKLLWDGKKLGLKMEYTSSFLYEGNMVYFFTEKEFIGIDVSTGQVKIKTDLKDAKLGETLTSFIDENQTVIALMEKGFCALDLKTGNINYTTKLKDISGYFTRNGNYFLLVGDDQDEFVGVDIKTGKLRGLMEGSERLVTDDGKFIVAFDNDKITKYKVD